MENDLIRASLRRLLHHLEPALVKRSANQKNCFTYLGGRIVLPSDNDGLDQRPGGYPSKAAR